jgi:low affinity Fe/Cu permease
VLCVKIFEMDKIDYKIKKTNTVGLTHNSRQDVRTLMTVVNDLIETVNELVDEVNELRALARKDEP